MPRTSVPSVAKRRLRQAASIQSAPTALSHTPASIEDSPRPHLAISRVSHRRSRKAERDERMDITAVLTPVKTYMGGFTQPRHIRSSSWQTGGYYSTSRKVYCSPPPDAYTSRTAYILEARYPTIYGHGRVDSIHRQVGVCEEGHLPALVSTVNSADAGSDFLQPMDNARWPWVKPRRRKHVRWWEEGENPVDLRERALDGTHTLSSSQPQASTSDRPARHSKRRSVPTELLAAGAQDVPHIRAFHTSAVARRPDEDDRSAFERRRQDIPASAWSRPPAPSQDSDDNVVPTYYVERKKQRDSISERKEEEGGLMAELNAGILSDELAAQTRIREEKIPVEVRLPDGTIAHPSGFEPPTPETDFHPVAAKVPTEGSPLVATAKQPWDDRDFVEAGADPITICPETEAEWIQRMVASGTDNGVVSGVRDISAERSVDVDASASSPASRSKIPTSAWDSPTRVAASPDDPDNVVPPFYIERKRQRDSIEERKEEEGGLMAELNAGILSDDVAARTRVREEKIPVEVVLDDGTIAHPSGFVPPTAETEFHPVAAKPGDVPKQTWPEALLKKPGESQSRGLHTSAVARAQELATFHHASTRLQRLIVQHGLTSDLSEESAVARDTVGERRARYLPTLPSAPFWRPLLTVTLETRPLARSVARLGKSLGKGTPYFAAIEDQERKDFDSFNTRLRNLQLDRVQGLVYDLAMRMKGMRGGLLGVRFKPEDKGRGVEGQGLADPIPKEKRMVKIGVGEWYPLAEEVKERFLADAVKGGYEDCIEVFGVDQWGKRTDGVEWRGEREAREQKVRGMALIDVEESEELDVD